MSNRLRSGAVHRLEARLWTGATRRDATRSPAGGLRRVEARLWTGAAGHLAGGAADFIEALARYAIARVTRARVTPPRVRTARTTARRRAGG